MSVPVAYATIIIVWSTTPIGIAWSNDTVSPFMAILLRMSVATVIGLFILRVIKQTISWKANALRTYGFSLLGVYVALSCTYIAAQYVPSGIVSVMYALSPIMSTLLAKLLLGKGDFGVVGSLSFGVSFAGLAFIFADDWVLAENGIFGLFLLLLSVFLYSLGGVMVQKAELKAHPLSITVGTLVISLPLFLLTWLFLDGKPPTIDWSSRSPWAILYLAIFGSLIGFACYFFIVKELGATAVAMVTLMTPVIALGIGHIVNNEIITKNMIVGTGFVLMGLFLYYFANDIESKARKTGRLKLG